MNDFDMLQQVVKGKAEFAILTDQETINHWKYFHPETEKIINLQNSPESGYGGFLSTWLFDINGNLIAVGHYED